MMGMNWERQGRINKQVRDNKRIGKQWDRPYKPEDLMQYGKHKGESLEWIEKKDPSYYEWLKRERMIGE